MSAQLDLYDVVYGSKSELAIKELADLRARIAELEAMTQWQPIESAPKDSKSIILLDRNGTSYSGFWRNHTGWNPDDNNHLSCYDTNPTHWMPLPEPPISDHDTEMLREGRKEDKLSRGEE